MPSSLPYVEPSAATLLIVASLLLLLNILNSVFDALLSCGLIAQVFLGTLYGVPGVDWLGVDAQEGMVVLGYLGLILLVYEGFSSRPPFPCQSIVFPALRPTRSPF
jgi:hypothetical protein